MLGITKDEDTVEGSTEVAVPELPEVGFEDTVIDTMNIIGVEMRVQNRYTGVTKELALLPCNIKVPSTKACNGIYGMGNNFQPMFQLPLTIHTTEGDINVTADLTIG